MLDKMILLQSGKYECKSKVELGAKRDAKECTGMNLAVLNGRPFQKASRKDCFQWRCSLGGWDGCNLPPSQGPADLASAISDISHIEGRQ
jgi:hypothetical protein